MAGAKAGEFKEIISPFLRAKMQEALDQGGPRSSDYLALARQYIKSPMEQAISADERGRHYESVVTMEFEGKPLVGVERLYKHTILLEPTTVCAAHCRWCLRGQYPIQTMNFDQIEHATRYFGSGEPGENLREVLITGGDPLTSPPRLRSVFENLRKNAPNIKIVRIGSRVPFHNPDLVNEALLELFSKFPEFIFELGVNVNHPVEFWPESIAAVRRLRDNGVRIYNQHPLLKGVNDDFATLVRLYTLLRENQIEAHYLFHAIPMRGMRHHRTTLERGLELANAISSCGEFSGRAKPKYAVLSDIGKIVLYHDTIVDRNPQKNLLLLRSGFSLKNRLSWNPSWSKPASTVVDESGNLLTWYMNGTDESIESLVNESLQRGTGS